MSRSDSVPFIAGPPAFLWVLAASVTILLVITHFIVGGPPWVWAFLPLMLEGGVWGLFTVLGFATVWRFRDHRPSRVWALRLVEFADGSVWLTLPPAVRKALGVREGDFVEFRLQARTIVLRKAWAAQEEPAP